MNQKIASLLTRIGIRPSYKGYPYLVHVIMLASEVTDSINLTKLYQQTAELYKVSPNVVQHDIRTVLKVYWNMGHIEKLEEIIGYPIYEKLTVKEFIYMIVDYLVDRQ